MPILEPNLLTIRQRPPAMTERTARKPQTPMQQLLARVCTWCGVNVAESAGVTCVMLKSQAIARFPCPETLEASLCGTIQKQVERSPLDLPAGVWPHRGNRTVLIDLTQPGGMEEAIRVLLNAYIMAQDPGAREWWLEHAALDEDPTCEKVAEVIARHRGEARMADRR